MSITFDVMFAYLEEDDVQHAYFRVHPLMTIDGPVGEAAKEAWPDNGCLRIVPDRNEQHTFKSRMRTLGHFCMVDVRRTPAGLDKIRANKNYRPEHGETNQFILYSDTVRAVPAGPFFEIIGGSPEDAAALAECATTPLYYIRSEGILYGPVNRAEPAAPEAAVLPEESAEYSFFCPDEKERTYLCVPALVPPTEEPRRKAKNIDERVSELDAPVSGDANLLRENGALTPPEDLPKEPLNGTPLRQSTYRTATPAPKNRLQEVVHSQWKVVKDTPPTASLPRGAELKQVENPVEQALAAMGSAWRYPQAREQIVTRLLALDGMQTVLDQVQRHPAGVSALQRTVRAKLDELEADRLSILVQLDQAKMDMEHFRRDAVAGATEKSRQELTELEAKKTAIQGDIDTLARQVQLLTAQREELTLRVDQLQSEQLPEALAKALTDARIGMAVEGPSLHLAPVSGQTLPPKETVTRFQDALRRAGWDADQATAAAVLTLVALCRRIGIVTHSAAVTGTLMRNSARLMGWSSGFAVQSTLEERPLVSFLPTNATPAVLATLLPSYAPLPDTVKIFLAHMAVQLTRTTPYSADQWPILTLPELPALAETDEEGEPVSLTSVQELLQHTEFFRADQVLADVLGCVPPMSGLALREMNRFVTVAAQLMEGGLPAACDWAISLWLVPQVIQSPRQCAELSEKLTEYPVASRLLQARLTQASESTKEK